MDRLFSPARPVFIVGGGASLRSFDWSRLKRRQTIAINLAYRTVPWADVLFFSDNAFFEHHRDPGGQHFWRFRGSRILTTASYCGGMKGRLEYVPPSELAPEGSGIDPAQLNSGAQAILLAHQLGAKKIVLLGFDNRPGHWADRLPYAHPRKPDPSAFDRYEADMAAVAALGLDIVNASPRSALTAFPAAELDMLL